MCKAGGRPIGSTCGFSGHIQVSLSSYHFVTAWRESQGWCCARGRPFGWDLSDSTVLKMSQAHWHPARDDGTDRSTATQGGVLPQTCGFVNSTEMLVDCNLFPWSAVYNRPRPSRDSTSLLPTEAIGPSLSSTARWPHKMEYPVYFFTSDHNICA